jgi:hypothetical protein
MPDKLPDLRSGSLDKFFLDMLMRNVAETYPHLLKLALVDHYKIDGWNDGTATLFGVFGGNGEFWRVQFPDYREPTIGKVSPEFAHVGWR